METYPEMNEEQKADLHDQNLSQSSKNSNRMTTRSMKKKLAQDN